MVERDGRLALDGFREHHFGCVGRRRLNDLVDGLNLNKRTIR